MEKTVARNLGFGLIALGGIAAVALLAVSTQEADAKYEQPKYVVVKAFPEADIEIREYAPRIAAEVDVPGEKSEAMNTGFKILAGYIFGGNKSKQKIAMTAPVTASQNGGQPARSEKIAMTAPVTVANQTDGAWKVRFYMPSKYSLDALPTPNDDRIKFVELPAQKFAVLKFSGTWSETKFKNQQAKLADFAKEQNIPVADGQWMSAYYNPPFTLPFMRRNEILAPLR